MSEIEDKLQVDRLNNLITGFGWKITNEEYTESRIILRVERARTPAGESLSPGPG